MNDEHATENAQTAGAVEAAPSVTQNGIRRPTEGADKILFDLFDGVSSAINSATTLHGALNNPLAESVELHLPEGVKDSGKYIRAVYLKWVQFHGVYDIIKIDAEQSKVEADNALEAANAALEEAKEAFKAARSAQSGAVKYLEKADIIATNLRDKSAGRAAKSQERKVEAAKAQAKKLAAKLAAAGINIADVI